MGDLKNRNAIKPLWETDSLAKRCGFLVQNIVLLSSPAFIQWMGTLQA